MIFQTAFNKNTQKVRLHLNSGLELVHSQSQSTRYTNAKCSSFNHLIKLFCFNFLFHAYVLLDQNSLADEMRRRENERVSVRQGYGYDLNNCRHNKQMRFASGRDFNQLRHPPNCFGPAVDIIK
jgi:hypothetical protein